MADHSPQAILDSLPQHYMHLWDLKQQNKVDRQVFRQQRAAAHNDWYETNLENKRQQLLLQRAADPQLSQAWFDNKLELTRSRLHARRLAAIHRDVEPVKRQHRQLEVDTAWDIADGLLHPAFDLASSETERDVEAAGNGALVLGGASEKVNFMEDELRSMDADLASFEPLSAAQPPPPPAHQEEVLTWDAMYRDKRVRFVLSPAHTAAYNAEMALQNPGEMEPPQHVARELLPHPPHNGTYKTIPSPPLSTHETEWLVGQQPSMFSGATDLILASMGVFETLSYGRYTDDFIWDAFLAGVDMTEAEDILQPSTGPVIVMGLRREGRYGEANPCVYVDGNPMGGNDYPGEGFYLLGHDDRFSPSFSDMAADGSGFSAAYVFMRNPLYAEACTWEPYVAHSCSRRMCIGFAFEFQEGGPTKVVLLVLRASGENAGGGIWKRVCFWSGRGELTCLTVILTACVAGMSVRGWWRASLASGSPFALRQGFGLTLWTSEWERRAWYVGKHVHIVTGKACSVLSQAVSVLEMEASRCAVAVNSMGGVANVVVTKMLAQAAVFDSELRRLEALPLPFPAQRQQDILDRLEEFYKAHRLVLKCNMLMRRANDLVSSHDF